MDHNRGTKTCLVGEDTSLHTPGNSELEAVACDTAADSLHGESAAENGSKDFRHPADMHDQNDESAEHIGNCHERHEFLRDCRDTLDAADDNQCGKDHQNDTRNIGGDSEHLVQVGADRVDLAHVADTERGDGAEHTEKHCQNSADLLASGFGTETVVQIVHSSAAPLADFVFTAVIDTQHVFGEVCHHAEERDDPHPEDRARAARDDGRRDTGDITCTDRRRQSCTQTLELADGLVILCRVRRYMTVCKNRADGF